MAEKTNVKTTEVKTNNAVAKATAIVEKEGAKVSFADKRLQKAQEQASEGKFFRAGLNRLIGNIAKHPVAVGIGVGAVGAAGAIGYALGARNSTDDADILDDGDELDDVTIVEEPVE